MAASAVTALFGAPAAAVIGASAIAVAVEAGRDIRAESDSAREVGDELERLIAEREKATEVSELERLVAERTVRPFR